MPIENRNLEEGTRLVARHKGKQYVCEVVQTEEGLRYRVAGRDFSSPSSAGGAVTGGAVNGWRFWSLEGDVKSAKERKAKSEKPAKSKTARTVRPKAKKRKSAKKATKKAARAASRDSYGCGVYPETFPTLKAATRHALEHTQH